MGYDPCIDPVATGGLPHIVASGSEADGTGAVLRRVVKVHIENAVKIQPTGRFKALHDIVNVEYLRPYNERSENVGPPPDHLSVKPVAVEPLGEWYRIAEILNHRGTAGPTQQCLVRWEGFDASHDSWVSRRDVTPKALIAYEEFLRSFDGLKSSLPYNHAGHSKEGYTQTQRTTFKKRLTSFIGENGIHSVLGNSDNRRTSKMSAPRGARGQTDARRNGVEDPKISTTASNSASDTDAPAATEGRRGRKPLGFYRV